MLALPSPVPSLERKVYNFMSPKMRTREAKIGNWESISEKTSVPQRTELTERSTQERQETLQANGLTWRVKNYNSATAKVETTQLKTHKDYNRRRAGMARKRNACQTLRKMHPLQTQKTWCEDLEKSDPLCAGWDGREVVQLPWKAMERCLEKSKLG